MTNPPTSLNLALLHSVDSLPLDNARADIIDMQRVEQHIARASESGRYIGPLDPTAYLRMRKCLVDDTVTLAGLLCFGRDPQIHVPRAVIDLGHYRSNDPLASEVMHLEKDIGGSIFDQLTHIEAYIWRNIHHGMSLNDQGIERVEIHEYPRVVIRELCVNMIAHRDYTNFRSAARVQLFRNRIEWISPGGLLPGITVENILDEQATRNGTILHIMYEAGLLEAFGQGLNTVVSVLERERLSPPLFRDTGASFIATVYGRPLDLFLESGYANLNDTQNKVLALLRRHGKLTPRDIQTYVSRSRRSLQRDLQGLVQLNLIFAEGEGRALHYTLVQNAILDV